MGNLFTVDEWDMILLYHNMNRSNTILTLRNIAMFFQDKNLCKIAAICVNKLMNLTDQEYDSLYSFHTSAMA